MIPLAAALSMRLTASRTASAVSSACCSAAWTAVLTRVLISERAALFRRRRRSFCLLRLIWLLMFATVRPGYTMLVFARAGTPTPPSSARRGPLPRRRPCWFLPGRGPQPRPPPHGGGPCPAGGRVDFCPGGD